jgi:hypothetical protein
MSRIVADLSGYMKLQSTRPQTLAYGLTDSPVGQLAWVVEKFREWTDSAKVPEDAVDRDQLLTNVMLYWLIATAGSSAQLYVETAELLPTAAVPPRPPHPLTVPLGERSSRTTFFCPFGASPTGPSRISCSGPSSTGAVTSPPWRSPIYSWATCERSPAP